MLFYTILVLLFTFSFFIEGFYGAKFISLFLFHFYSICYIYSIRGLNTGVIFSIISFLYILAGPADVFFWENSRVEIASVLDYTIKSTIFFTFFYFIMIVEKNGTLLQSINDQLKKIFKQDSLFVSIIFLLGILTLNYIAALFSGANLFNRLDSYDNPNKIFEFAKIMFSILSIIYVSIFNKKNRIVGIMIILFALFEIIIFGNRRGWIVGILPIFYLMKNRFSFNFLRGKIILPLIILVFLILFLPLTRGVANNVAFLQFLSEFDIINWLRPGNTEFLGVHLIHYNIYNDILVDFSGTFLSSIYDSLPSFFVERTGNVFSLNFVKFYFPEIYLIGGGFRGSIITEIFLNFSYIGLIFFGIVFGKLFSTNNNLFLLNSLLIYIFAFSISYDFVLIFQQIFLISMIITLFYFIDLFLTKISRKV
jgi:hypothetical protein